MPQKSINYYGPEKATSPVMLHLNAPCKPLPPRNQPMAMASLRLGPRSEGMVGAIYG